MNSETVSGDIAVYARAGVINCNEASVNFPFSKCAEQQRFSLDILILLTVQACISAIAGIRFLPFLLPQIKQEFCVTLLELIPFNFNEPSADVELDCDKDMDMAVGSGKVYNVASSSMEFILKFKSKSGTT